MSKAHGKLNLKRRLELIEEDKKRAGNLVPPEAHQMIRELAEVHAKPLPSMAPGIQRIGSTSKAAGPNPKDVVGMTKAPILLFPPIAVVHASDAMADGAAKYDPYNWRAKNITLCGYLHAAMRHIMAVWEGEEFALDSLAKHLGHALATLGIVIDAQAHGCLIDDRPTSDGGEAFNRALDAVKRNIAFRKHRRELLEAAKVAETCSGRCSGTKKNKSNSPKRKR